MPPHIKKAHQRCSCLLQMHKNEPTGVVVFNASYWLWKKYFSSKIKWRLLNRPRIIKITMTQEVMTNKDLLTILLRYWLQNQWSQMIKVCVGPLTTTVTTWNQPAEVTFSAPHYPISFQTLSSLPATPTHQLYREKETGEKPEEWPTRRYAMTKVNM